MRAHIQNKDWTLFSFSLPIRGWVCDNQSHPSNVCLTWGSPQSAFSPCLSESSQERARCAGQKAGVRTPHRSPLDPQCHAIQPGSLWPGNQVRHLPNTKVGEGVVGTPHRSPHAMRWYPIHLGNNQTESRRAWQWQSVIDGGHSLRSKHWEPLSGGWIYFTRC